MATTMKTLTAIVSNRITSPPPCIWDTSMLPAPMTIVRATSTAWAMNPRNPVIAPVVST